MKPGFAKTGSPGKRALRAAAVCGLLSLCGYAKASITVLLEQPYGNLGHFDPGGHTAIYLDHVCADGPLKLRPCRDGELGVVISRYDGIEKLDWVAMPLMGYLYAVDSADEIPETMDKPGEVALRDKYRRAHLETVAPDLPDGGAPGGNWYELAGSSYDRKIYGFRVKSTPDQDARLIAVMNDSKNVEKYNGFYANCADFVRIILNKYYPHASRRNWIADVGVTSPKNVAKNLAHYGKKHPEVELQTFVIPQVKGTLPRSHSAEGVLEGIVRRYGIPLTVLSPTTTAVALVAYVGQGRFEMPKNAMVVDLHDAAAARFLEEESVETVAPESVVGGSP